MFSEFTFKGEGGGSAQKDQRFTFFIDIELWTRSLKEMNFPFGIDFRRSFAKLILDFERQNLTDTTLSQLKYTGMCLYKTVY